MSLPRASSPSRIAAWRTAPPATRAATGCDVSARISIDAGAPGDGGKVAPKRPFVVRLDARYRRLLGVVLHHRALVIGVAVAAFLAIMLGLAPQAGFVMFPQDDSEALHLKVTTPLGTSGCVPCIHRSTRR